jgi:ferredoxin-NADP reductase
MRHKIGPGLWRKAHRATILVYVLSVAHTLGAGTDASEPWMRMLLLVTGAPILFLFVMRVLTPPSGPVYRRYRVAAIEPESRTVCSFELEPAGRRRIGRHRAGQFVTVRDDVPGRGPVLRSYSLSRASRVRISVKREAGGVMSEHLHAGLKVGDTVELSGPSGAFTLDEGGTRPLVLISAGIGVTPVLAMLDALAARRSRREVWWVHGARNRREHPFRAEVREHLAQLENGYRHVRYSRPDELDVPGPHFDAEGRVTARVVLDLGVPLDAEFRLCGPTAFVAELEAGLREAGVDAARIASESFGGAAPARPAPAAPAAAPLTVAFSRSGVTTAWDPSCGSLLELAEANSVPAASGCRMGACHGCKATVLEGDVRHDPEPAQPPAAGSALLCCAVPQGDLVLEA